MEAGTRNLVLRHSSTTSNPQNTATLEDQIIYRNDVGTFFIICVDDLHSSLLTAPSDQVRMLDLGPVVFYLGL